MSNFTLDAIFLRYGVYYRDDIRLWDDVYHRDDTYHWDAILFQFFFLTLLK